jgi:hypothetical protein
MKNKTYWVVTDKAEVSFTDAVAKVAHKKALQAAEVLVAFGIKVTILCEGNIVWVG